MDSGAKRNPDLAKTILSAPAPQVLSANPFNRVRYTVNEIEGRWDAAVRALDKIRTCTDLRVARETAAEALQIMARTTERT